jgi:hypothetical protein
MDLNMKKIGSTFFSGFQPPVSGIIRDNFLESLCKATKCLQMTALYGVFQVPGGNVLIDVGVLFLYFFDLDLDDTNNAIRTTGLITDN